jgi:hypothetical protein
MLLLYTVFLFGFLDYYQAPFGYFWSDIGFSLSTYSLTMSVFLSLLLFSLSIIPLCNLNYSYNFHSILKRFKSLYNFNLSTKINMFKIEPTNPYLYLSKLLLFVFCLRKSHQNKLVKPEPWETFLVPSNLEPTFN